MAVARIKSTSSSSGLSLSDIHEDLLALIASKNNSIEDCVRFGAVCRLWRRLATDLLEKKSLDLDRDHDSYGGNFQLSPWLILADKVKQDSIWSSIVEEALGENNSEKISKRRFCSIAGDGGGGEVFELKLRGIRGTRCWGSPHGWLVVYSYGLAFYLFNPLSGASVPLPKVRRFFWRRYRRIHGYCLRPPMFVWFQSFLVKAVLTASPESPDCLVFMIYFENHQLAFAKPGNENSVWTPIEGPDLWSDIIYFKGNIYGCRKDGQVLIFDLTSGTQPVAVEFAPPPPHLLEEEGHNYITITYLVDLGGELCLVVRCVRPGDERLTFEFRVYKIDLTTKEWRRVLSLDDRWCLFLGTNYSYAVRSSNRLIPNCIYFTDDDDPGLYYYKRTGRDIGIYHLGKGELTAFTVPASVAEELVSELCPPVWFTPALP